MAILFRATPPYRAIGFRGKLLLRYPPSKACLWIAIDHFHRKKWGCSSDSLRYHRTHIATGVLLHLSRDRGRYFGRVTKKWHDQSHSNLAKKARKKNKVLGSVFGRTDFSQIFFFGRRIFSQILSPDFFSSFLWERVPRTILQENPPKFIPQKSLPRHAFRSAG